MVKTVYSNDNKYQQILSANVFYRPTFFIGQHLLVNVYRPTFIGQRLLVNIYVARELMANTKHDLFLGSKRAVLIKYDVHRR